MNTPKIIWIPTTLEPRINDHYKNQQSHVQRNNPEHKISLGRNSMTADNLDSGPQRAMQKLVGDPRSLKILRNGTMLIESKSKIQ